MEFLKKWKIENIPVYVYKKSQHCSKNYCNTVCSFKDSPVPKIPLDEAIHFLLHSEQIPAAERDGIQRFTVYTEDHIIALHCVWAPTIFEMRDAIYQQIGWYPYVTGLLLQQSAISAYNDTWLNHRNFNMLEFPDFPVTDIRLQNLNTGDGTAFLLHINDFQILLDCCFDLHKPREFSLEERPDLIFLSHAHNDHIASLEACTSQYPGIPLLMSFTTLDLLTYFKKKSSSLITYLNQNAYPLIFNDIYPINTHLALRILKAGHYPGAAMLSISTTPHNILYTGDLFLHDLQPLKGSGSGIHNLNGLLDTLILDGQFSNRYISSQKLLLDRACTLALQAIRNGGPVIVLGDPGSWLLMFYLKFYYFFTHLNMKYRIYIDEHTIEIMKILRYRQEDITPYLAQEILRFHDPFASIVRQDLADLDLETHSPDDPPIILFNARNYAESLPDYLSHIFDNPNALVIITFPIRSDPLDQLWQSLTYHTQNSPKPLQCTVFDHNGNPNEPRFSLHVDKLQILEILRHLNPSNIVLFHNTPEKLTTFQDYFTEKLSWLYPDTQIHSLQDATPLILYDAEVAPVVPVDTANYFFPLIKTLELIQHDGLHEVGYSLLAQKLSSKFPYWKDTVGTTKLSDYIHDAVSAHIVEVRTVKSETYVKLKP